MISGTARRLHKKNPARGGVCSLGCALRSVVSATAKNVATRALIRYGWDVGVFTPADSQPTCDHVSLVPRSLQKKVAAFTVPASIAASSACRLLAPKTLRDVRSVRRKHFTYANRASNQRLGRCRDATRVAIIRPFFDLGSGVVTTPLPIDTLPKVNCPSAGPGTARRVRNRSACSQRPGPSRTGNRRRPCTRRRRAGAPAAARDC